jgi:putative exporter of polyketide antibiotics
MIRIVVARVLGRMLVMKPGHSYVCICIECCMLCFLLSLNGANMDYVQVYNDQYDMQVQSYLVLRYQIYFV